MEIQPKKRVTGKLERLMKKIGKLIAQGYSTKEIAATLNYSVPTMTNYICQMLKMYNCCNRTQLAVKIALENAQGNKN